MLLGEASAGGPADLHRLEAVLPDLSRVVRHSAADVVDNLAQRRAEGNLDQAGVGHVPGEREGLGARRLFGADAAEDLGAYVENARNMRQRLHVVDDRSACPTVRSARGRAAWAGACRAVLRWRRSWPSLRRRQTLRRLPSPRTSWRGRCRRRSCPECLRARRPPPRGACAPPPADTRRARRPAPRWRRSRVPRSSCLQSRCADCPPSPSGS